MGETFDFFLQPQLVLFELRYLEIVASGVMKLALDFTFKGLVPIAEFRDMRI
jgi:hypothetical protein